MKLVRILLALAVCLVAAEPLTNVTVIRMVQAGVPAEVIVSTIRSADAVQFGLLSGDLAQLQQAKVPDDVIKAMAARMKSVTPPNAQTPAIQAPAPAPLAPAGNHDRQYKKARVLDSSVDINRYLQSIMTFGSSSSNSTTSTRGSFDAHDSANGRNLSGSLRATSDTTTTGTSNSQTYFYHTTIQRNELLLVADDYLYVTEDTRERSEMLLRHLIHDQIVNRKHGCRFVVGEDIWYSQDKGNLYILDADDKECKVPVLRQEKR